MKNLSSLATVLALSAGPAVAGTTPEAEVQTPVDPFANLPIVRLGEADVTDTSGLTHSEARKYLKGHEAAIGAKMPIQPNWKYASALFQPGVVKESRPGSVFHSIQDIVGRAGKAGITSYELATQLRKAQIGNKRSHYCTALPPIGWAEGYINSAVQQGMIKVHATKKAPALVVAAAQAEAKAEGAIPAKGDAAQK